MPLTGGCAVRITIEILQRFYCRAQSAFPSLDTIAYKWFKRGRIRGPKLPVARGSTADGTAHGVSSQILLCASPEPDPTSMCGAKTPRARNELLHSFINAAFRHREPMPPPC